MNVFPIDKHAQILNVLVEGNSLRSTFRIAALVPDSVPKKRGSYKK